MSSEVKIPFKIIDVHVHLPLEPEFAFEDVRNYWKNSGFLTDDEYYRLMKPDKLVELLDKWNVEWVNVISYYAKETMGFGYEFIDAVGKFCSEYPDRLHFVMGADPYDDKAVERLEYFREKYGSYWIKIHPPHALIKPNDYRPEEGNVKTLRKIYEYTESEGMIITIHTGTSAFPRSRNKYANPIYIEDVLVDFPKLKIVIAHGGRPIKEWMDTAYYLVEKYDNAYLDISGIPPKNLLNYFPNLEKIKDKVLFGTDWYSPGVKGILDNALQIMSLPLSFEAKRDILRDNAVRLVNLIKSK